MSEKKKFLFLLVFQNIITVLVYRILFYPFFACLTTDNRLVGSLLGFLYVTIRWASYYFVYEYQFNQTVSLFFNYQIQFSELYNCQYLIQILL